METIIKTENLTKTFGYKTAVKNLNLTVNKGDIYGFIGKNGAGKTTAMRMITGLCFPTSGKIELFGGEDLDSARKKTGSLIEAPSLFKGCTAYENLKRFSYLTGATDEEIYNVLLLVGLADTGNKKVKFFSLGMKQRLGLAAALLGKPEMLILDEPVNGLDPEGIKFVRDLLLKLNREHGVTILISSHLLDELSKIATKYGIINDGVLVDEITAEALNEKCSVYLKIKTSDNLTAFRTLSPLYPDGDVFIDGDHLVVKNVSEGEEPGAKLFGAGVSVNEMTTEKRGIEEYFIDKISGRG